MKPNQFCPESLLRMNRLTLFARSLLIRQSTKGCDGSPACSIAGVHSAASSTSLLSSVSPWRSSDSGISKRVRYESLPLSIRLRLKLTIWLKLRSCESRIFFRRSQYRDQYP